MKTRMFVDGHLTDAVLPDEYPCQQIHCGVYRSDDGHSIAITRAFTASDLRDAIKVKGPRVTVMKVHHAYLTMTMLRGIINASEAYGVSIIMSLCDGITHANAKDLTCEILVTLPHD